MGQSYYFLHHLVNGAQRPVNVINIDAKQMPSRFAEHSDHQDILSCSSSRETLERALFNAENGNIIKILEIRVFVCVCSVCLIYFSVLLIYFTLCICICIYLYTSIFVLPAKVLC
jgi:hypothetical protein